MKLSKLFLISHEDLFANLFSRKMRAEQLVIILLLRLSMDEYVSGKPSINEKYLSLGMI